MTERPGGPPADGPLPPHLDPRGRGGRRARERPRQPEPTAAAPPGAVLPPTRRRGRVLRRLALLVVLVLLVASVGVIGTLLYYDRRIDRVPVASLGAGPDVDGGDVNYLLVGSDSRAGLTPEEIREAGTGSDDGRDSALTDTLVLIHVPGDGGEPTFVSFPRDSWVEIPGAGRGRINSAFAVGERQQKGSGPDKLVETVSQLSGLTIDHYLEVGFIAFLRITDALGGVEVNLCRPAQDEKANIDLPAGEQRLSGGDALGFVRQRDGLPRGDLDRIRRQQYFLGAVARQVLSPQTLVRPDRALRLADAVTSSIRADEDLSTFDLARLGLRLRGAASGGLSFETLPVADANARRGGASVVLLDEPALPGFFAGLSPETRAEPPATVQVPPSSIRLAVLNGTARAGLAGEAARQLEGQGYTVTRTGNAEVRDARTSVVLHGSGRADSARTVAASVPGAETRQDDSIGENGLALVVGEDFSGVRPVTVAPAGGAAASPSPAPATPQAPGSAAPAPSGGAPAPQEDTGRPCVN